MKKLNVKPVKDLPVVDGKYIIQNSNDAFLIDNDCSVVIEPNIIATIIDNSKNSEIEILVSQNSTLNNLVTDSIDCRRHFNVNGKLNYTQIALIETKENLCVDLEVENAEALIKTLCIASSYCSYLKQNVNHNAKQTLSNVNNVAVAFNKGDINFDITGKISKTMSKSRCQQLTRGIIMDNDSSVCAKPILLIDEYDCFANHGAAIGKMSDDDLFYLMSRGLNKNEAFLLILQGIIKPFIDSLEDDEMKERIDNEISKMIEK